MNISFQLISIKAKMFAVYLIKSIYTITSEIPHVSDSKEVGLQGLNAIGQRDHKAVDHSLGGWGSRPQVGPEAVKRGQLDEKADILYGSRVGILMGCT